MRIAVKNVEMEFKRLSKLQQDVLAEQGAITVGNLVRDLKQATPIDTGLARRSWTTAKKGEVFTVSNDVSYIQYLNQGTSKQAPAYYVEAIALAYGKPQGTIVEVIPD